MFALTWDDIDFENKIITVNKTVYSKLKDNNGRWFLGTTKTKGSCREVYICNTLYKILCKYKNEQESLKKIYGRKYKKYEKNSIKNKYGKVNEFQICECRGKSNLQMIFTKEDGTYSGTDIIKYPYKIIHKELGIKNCRFYDLRGSYATKCLRNGVEIKDVASILGHSKIETTENYYVSSTEETRKKANEFLEKTIQSDVINKIINFEKYLQKD